jgi:hypothetical protein
MSSVMTGGRAPWFPLWPAGLRPSREASQVFSLLLGRYSFLLRGDLRSPHDLCTIDS